MREWGQDCTIPILQLKRQVFLRVCQRDEIYFFGCINFKKYKSCWLFLHFLLFDLDFNDAINRNRNYLSVDFFKKIFNFNFPNVEKGLFSCLTIRLTYPGEIMVEKKDMSAAEWNPLV